MGSIAGNSAGFGRIRVDTRPSPYTPFHLAVAPRAAQTPAQGNVLTRALAGAALVVLAVVAVALAVGLVVTSRGEPGSAVEAMTEPAATLDHEAERLTRSAFATQRRARG